MPTATKYSKKQLKTMMERYATMMLEPVPIAEAPVTFAYETSQYQETVSCHLRTTKGIVIQVNELVGWFEKLPKKNQSDILG